MSMEIIIYDVCSVSLAMNAMNVMLRKKKNKPLL